MNQDKKFEEILKVTTNHFDDALKKLSSGEEPVKEAEKKTKEE